MLNKKSTRSTAAYSAALLVAVAGLSGGCSRGDDRNRIQLAHADALVRQGNLPEAVAEYRRVLDVDSKDPRANEQLGAAHLQLGELTPAYHFLLKAQGLDPSRASVHLKLGTIYLIGSKLDEAREQAYAILDKDPSDVQALMLLAGAINASAPDDAPQAIKKLEDAKPRFGNDALPRLALGSLYLRQGDAAAAKRLFQEAVTIDPKSAEARGLLRAFYASHQDAGSADAELSALHGLAVGGPVRVRMAQSYLLTGNRDEAKAILREAVEKEPDHIPASKLLGELAIADGNAEETAKAVAPVFLKDTSDVDALVLRGRRHILLRETPAASADFRRALGRSPGLAPIHYQLGLADLQKANASGKKEVLDTALKDAKAQLERAIELAWNYPEAALQLAALKSEAGVPQAAIADLGRFIESNPRSVKAKTLLATALLAMGRVGEADEVTQQVVQIAPRNAEGHYWAGVVLAREGKVREAKAELEAAANLLPTFIEPTTQLVLIDLAENHVDLALTRIKKQVELVPRSAALAYLLGLVSGARAEPSAAEAAFLKAIELDPRLVDAHVRLAEIYDASGRLDLAVAHADDGLKWDPKNTRALMVLGTAYQTKGDAAKARQAYERYLVLNPRDLSAANNLAVLLSEEQQGDLEGALKFATLARDIAPDDPHVSDTLGWILYRRGGYEEASKLVKASAARLPDSPAIQYHLGMIAQRLGDTVAARQALTKALTSSTGFAGKDEARKALTQLK